MPTKSPFKNTESVLPFLIEVNLYFKQSTFNILYENLFCEILLLQEIKEKMKKNEKYFKDAITNTFKIKKCNFEMATENNMHLISD